MDRVRLAFELYPLWRQCVSKRVASAEHDHFVPKEENAEVGDLPDRMN